MRDPWLAPEHPMPPGPLCALLSLCGGLGGGTGRAGVLYGLRPLSWRREDRSLRPRAQEASGKGAHGGGRPQRASGTRLCPSEREETNTEGKGPEWPEGWGPVRDLGPFRALTRPNTLRPLPPCLV